MTPEFIHHYEAKQPDGPDTTLLVLHGTGGDEHDLVPLAKMLAPGAAILSPRGKVLENGAPRFFRRLSEGVFDEDDLRARSHELADFVAAAAEHYGFDAGNVVALGFSNGANIASSLMLLRPDTLKGGALLRGMVPFEPETLPDLTGVRVLLANGRRDPIVPVENAERLEAMLKEAGATVTHEWNPASHALIQSDLKAAQAWFATLSTTL